MATKLLALKFRWPMVLILGCLAMVMTGARAQEAEVSEDELKAAFLYNFTRFVEWPKEAFKAEEDKLEVAIYQDENFARVLGKLLKDKRAHGRLFKVKNVTSASEAKSSHVLFIPKDESRKTPELLEDLTGLPLLTIGESPQFLNQGGIINFRFQENQLRFEIHAGAADKAKLQVSSQLMRLATNVKRGGGK